MDNFAQLPQDTGWLPFNLSEIFGSPYALFCSVAVTLGIGLLCYAFFGGLLKIEKEKRAFQRMIMSPSDATVRAYIRAYKKTCGPLAFVTHIYLPITFYNHGRRRATGWETIKESKYVSDELKNELKSLYIAHGVVIK